jgi:uroporphyrin-III C-methyltransferase/precorrin-2 dehydrogenase/sirohydrochlorin ferrochelatase
MTYPLFLQLSGRRCVVVGGGPVAARRALAMAQTGALVQVVAPWATEDICDAAASGHLTWTQREYETGDLSGAWLVQTATGDPKVDAAVATDAEAARIWCVRADDHEQSPGWVPAVHNSGPVTVAVTSSDPKRSVNLRNAIALLLDTGALPMRRHRPGPGRVSLVGGGPGADGFITVRGRQLLAEADVVIVDRLAPQGLLATLDEDVEVIDAGKAPHAHTLTQDQINDLLISRAQQGKHVVRLKGGDPFVLGRGGEEALACAGAGVPVEVVPGVTSGVSVPAAAGIPVTHRGLSRGFALVSGHEADIDWDGLRGADTLVVLMGVARIAQIRDELLAAGRDPGTPVAVIERGTTPQQRTTTGTLADIPAIATAADVQAPAIIVVGDVAALNVLG